MSPKWALLTHFDDISYDVIDMGNFFSIEATNIMFYHALSEAILYHEKPLDLNNKLSIFRKVCLPDFGVTAQCFERAQIFFCSNRLVSNMYNALYFTLYNTLYNAGNQ